MDNAKPIDIRQFSFDSDTNRRRNDSIPADLLVHGYFGKLIGGKRIVDNECG